jgi:hypothetical protein
MIDKKNRIKINDLQKAIFNEYWVKTFVSYDYELDCYNVLLPDLNLFFKDSFHVWINDNNFVESTDRISIVGIRLEFIKPYELLNVGVFDWNSGVSITIDDILGKSPVSKKSDFLDFSGDSEETIVNIITNENQPLSSKDFYRYCEAA